MVGNLTLDFTTSSMRRRLGVSNVILGPSIPSDFILMARSVYHSVMVIIILPIEGVWVDGCSFYCTCIKVVIHFSLNSTRCDGQLVEMGLI